MRRTSSKCLVVGLVFFVLGLVFMAWADYSGNKADRIKFSGVTTRPWNKLDFISIGAFGLFASLSAVSLMFAAKDD
jgi:hypothetical protein